MGHNRKITRGC